MYVGVERKTLLKRKTILPFIVYLHLTQILILIFTEHLAVSNKKSQLMEQN